ncbi:Spectinomycin tetracycline efflux pump [Gordonia bronchialis]|nr:Spectinomycin tetracycline efflux pump [Gordonia bronchialis]
MTTTVDAGTAPPRAGLVLTALILVAGVANINLAVANVALPDIGRELDASSTQLNLIAVGYSLGLAASVLYFGALGDRHGRKMTVILGTGLTIPASLVAGLAGNVEVLFGARVVGGVAAGLALIPSDHGDDDAKVDNLGGLLSIVMVGALVLALNFAPESDMRMTVYILAAIAIIGIGCFVYRQLHVRVPLFDLRHRRLRQSPPRVHRVVAECGSGHQSDRDRAHQILLQRRGSGRTLSAVRGADHRRGARCLCPR